MSQNTKEMLAVLGFLLGISGGLLIGHEIEHHDWQAVAVGCSMALIGAGLTGNMVDRMAKSEVSTKC